MRANDAEKLDAGLDSPIMMALFSVQQAKPLNLKYNTAQHVMASVQGNIV